MNVIALGQTTPPQPITLKVQPGGLFYSTQGKDGPWLPSATVTSATGVVSQSDYSLGVKNQSTTDSLQNISISNKESIITPGVTNQYWRGDKTWQTLNANAVGLGNVNNTSDANKPVSTAQQAALNLKADSSSVYTKLDINTLLVGKQNTLTFDVTPTNGSSNPVTSGGVYTALSILTTYNSIITSGSSFTLSNQTGAIWIIVNPTTVLSNLALTFPASPPNLQNVHVSFGGTLTTGTVVTSFSVAGNAGQTVLQPTSPSSIQAGETLSYRYNSTTSTWYRLY